LASNRMEGNSGKRTNGMLARIGLVGDSKHQFAVMVRDQQFEGRAAVSPWMDDCLGKWQFVAWVVKPSTAGTVIDMALFTGRAGATPGTVTSLKLSAPTFDTGLARVEPTAIAVGASIGPAHTISPGYHGKIAGVRLYKTALSPEEVQAVYAAAFSLPSSTTNPATPTTQPAPK
jgi:hypothetical protein